MCAMLSFVRARRHFRARAFVCLRQPSYFLFAWPKRKITKEKGHPAWRLPPIHGRQVREPGPGFSTGHPALAKRSRHPCRLPLRGLSTPTHRRTGAPVEQRAILARTLQKSREQRHSTARGLSCSFTRASVAEPIAGRLLATWSGLSAFTALGSKEAMGTGVSNGSAAREHRST